AAEKVAVLQQQEAADTVAQPAAKQAGYPANSTASLPPETIVAVSPPQANAKPASAPPLAAEAAGKITAREHRERVGALAASTPPPSTSSAEPAATSSAETVAPVASPASNAAPAIRPQPGALQPAPPSTDARTNTALPPRLETAQP